MAEIEKIEQQIEQEREATKRYESQATQVMPLRKRVLESYDIDPLDFATVVAGVICIVIAIFGVASPPAYGALFFGVALLITTAIHSRIYQIGVLFFTVMYWLLSIIFGVWISAYDISLFIFGINTISLGVFLVGSIAVATAGVFGFAEGLRNTYRWSGITILIFSIVLGLTDFFFAVYMFFYPIVDALIIVLVNMGVYTVALTITYIIFYYFARFYWTVKELFEQKQEETMEVNE